MRYVVDTSDNDRWLEERDPGEATLDLEDRGVWTQSFYEENFPISEIHPEKVWNDYRYDRAIQAIEEEIPIPPIDVTETAPGFFQITDGIHRYNAAKDLGLTTIPAIVERIQSEAPNASSDEIQRARNERELWKVFHDFRQLVPDSSVGESQAAPEGYAFVLDSFDTETLDDRPSVEVTVRVDGDARHLQMASEGRSEALETDLAGIPPALAAFVQQMGSIAPAAQATQRLTSSEDNGHTHTVDVPNPPSGSHETSFDAGHTHLVEFDGSASVETTEDNGHTHTFTVAQTRTAEDIDDEIVGLALRKSGKYLLVRRSEHENRAGQWEWPGGHVAEEDKNELYASVREAIEDLGGVPDDLTLVSTSMKPPWEDGPPVYYTTVLAEVGEDDEWEPDLNEEHDDWGWFAPGEMPENTHPGVLEIVEEDFPEERLARVGSPSRFGWLVPPHHSDFAPDGVFLPVVSTLGHAAHARSIVTNMGLDPGDDFFGASELLFGEGWIRISDREVEVDVLDRRKKHRVVDFMAQHFPMNTPLYVQETSTGLLFEPTIEDLNSLAVEEVRRRVAEDLTTGSEPA